MADGPVLVLDDNDSPTVVVVQNDLLRYLFTDDPHEWYDVTPFVTAAQITPGPATEGRWQPAQRS